MKKAGILLLTYLMCMTLHIRCEETEKNAEWLIIGDGVGGIASIGVLHDLGIPYEDIIWVGSDFNVGRIGELYSSVPANNITQKFIDFINACATFRECDAPSIKELQEQDPHEFPELGIIVPALKDITAYLRTRLDSYKGWLKDLHFAHDLWCAQVNNVTIKARHVILATGSHPRELNYENVSVIPLDYALNKESLAGYVDNNSTIGIIGGSHSGILIIKYLYELKIQKIINLFRSPIVYTVDAGGWNMNAFNGLKGLTAQFAREVLEGPNPPENIVRAFNNEENRKRYLPECDKIIYSVGFEQNPLPLSPEHQHLNYDDKTGVIAPRLFGIGVAFPEYYCDPQGNVDHRVGLTSFMDYAQRIIPQWVAGLGDDVQQRSELLRMRRKMLEQFADLFVIDIL
jgi:hypothetical protein